PTALQILQNELVKVLQWQPQAPVSSLVPHTLPLSQTPSRHMRSCGSPQRNTGWAAVPPQAGSGRALSDEPRSDRPSLANAFLGAASGCVFCVLSAAGGAWRTRSVGMLRTWSLARTFCCDCDWDCVCPRSCSAAAAARASDPAKMTALIP